MALGEPVTNDERADLLLAKLAPNWREHLNDGHVQEHIVNSLCVSASTIVARKLKVNEYNRNYHARGRQRKKAASA